MFKQMVDDLSAYASHDGRKTITETDVKLLMKRCVYVHHRFTASSELPDGVGAGAGAGVWQ